MLFSGLSVLENVSLCFREMFHVVTEYIDILIALLFTLRD